MTTVVVGVGNSWRGDDGAGLAVARALRALGPRGIEVREHEGDGLALLDAWGDAQDVIIVDAAQPPTPVIAAPGRVHSYDASSTALPVRMLRSSHLFGVAEGIELARALGRLPARVRVHAIEGAAFHTGAPLSPHVQRSADVLAGTLARELAGSPR